MSRRLVKSGSAADRPALVTLINFSLFSSHVSCDPPAVWCSSTWRRAVAVKGGVPKGARLSYSSRHSREGLDQLLELT
jgi:hypothetical protein